MPEPRSGRADRDARFARFAPARLRAASVFLLSIGILSIGVGAPAFAGPKTVRASSGAFERPPAGCTLGIAGPTLDPATALRAARDGAFAAMAAQRLGVELTSELSWIGTRVREQASERTRGTLHGAWIAALRPRPGGGVDAIACGGEVSTWPRTRVRGIGRGREGGERSAERSREKSGEKSREKSGERNRPATDSWPPSFRRTPGCAVGIAGPGLGPGDQADLAWRDAREMLARNVGMAIEHELLLDTGVRVRRRHAVSATPAARSLIEEADPTLARRQWLDRRGRGPLRSPGLLYVELCLPGAD